MILNVKGEPYRKLTLLDVATRAGPQPEELRQMMQKLSKRNPLLQEAPWRESVKILDQFGRPIWKDT